MSQIIEKEQYLLLAQSEIPNVRIDVQFIDKVYNKRYEMPVILTKCGPHPQTAHEFKTVLQEIKDKTFFQCQYCGSQASKINELQKDFRWLAYQEFNELVNEITLMNGFMFNKLQRRAQKLMPDANSKQLLQDIFARNVKENSLNQLILNQIITSNNKIKNQKTYFWAFCLLARVKITVPVRIINCQHIECYDLFSLIKYSQEQKNINPIIFQCRMPGCNNKLQMTNIENLFSGIFVDIDLLNSIKKANPSTYKFIYNIQKQTLEEEFFIDNGKKVDWMISQYYKKFYTNQLVLDYKYFEFQQVIQEKAVLVITSDMEGKDNLLKYKTYQVQMKDPLTNINIEYPARCKKCTEVTQCMDLRILIAEFLKLKEKSPASSFQCPLCKQHSGGQIASAQVNQWIYIDQNLLSQMYKDLSYVQTGIFSYQGDKYMLQEFLDRQKIPVDEYIKKLMETNKTTKVSYKQLYCSFNQNKILEFPLLINNCYLNTIIDFSTFYEKLKQMNFNLTEGIFFCKCEHCNSYPIKQIQSNIYFHEGLYKVLQELKKQNIQIKKDQTYTFDFATMELVQSRITIVKNDKEAMKNVKGQEGFTSLLDDEEYQKFFARDKIGNYAFKIKQIDSSIADGIYVTHKANGVQANLDQKVEQMNNYAQNSELKQWNFKVTNMTVELTNDLINSNKGEIQSKFY